jgi:hypothetical protein
MHHVGDSSYPLDPNAIVTGTQERNSTVMVGST